MAKYTINDLREGRVAVINDGTVEELNKVLEYAFPVDGGGAEGCFKFYHVTEGNEEYWFPADKVTIPTQSVKEFFGEIGKTNVPLTLGNCEFVRCDVWVGYKFRAGNVYTKKSANEILNRGAIGKHDISMFGHSFSPITEEEYVEGLKRAEKVTCEDSAQVGGDQSACISPESRQSGEVENPAKLTSFKVQHHNGFGTMFKPTINFVEGVSFDNGEVAEVIEKAVNEYLKNR
jgi:hypothetical protein